MKSIRTVLNVLFPILALSTAILANAAPFPQSPYYDVTPQQLEYRWNLIDKLQHTEGVQVVEVGDTMRVILSIDEFFKFPTDNRLFDYKAPIMDDVAHLFLTYGGRPLEVSGHSDNVGSDRQKLKRSAEQAETIAGFLWSGGVHLENLSTLGCADTKPISSDRTADGSAENRRIEITFQQKTTPKYFK